MKKRLLRFLGALAAVVFVFAASPLIANAAEGYKLISTEEVAKMLDTEPRPVLIFSLSQIEYLEARIAGSLCIPTERMEGNPMLPANRSATLIFYCKGPG